MKLFLKVIIIGISLIFILPAILIGVYGIERILGYYPGGHFPTVAKIAAEKRNVLICNKIINLPWPQIFGPTTSDSQISCIHEYAKLTKDPSACEGLMPSSYGISCVGGARSVPQPCFLKSDLSVGGNGIRASLKECVSGPENIRNNACCMISRVSSIIGQDDCSSLKDNPEMNDQCLNELAFKKKDSSICEAISHQNTRSACEVQTSAIKKNPSICSGCVPAISMEAASNL